MAFLIADGSVARFTSTVAFNSNASATDQAYVGRNDEANNSIATGTAGLLNLYISSWGSQTNIKCQIYDETNSGAWLESVVVSSSEGTGQIQVALANTTTITSGRLYRLGIYTEDADPVTFFSDGTGLTLRHNSSATGDYTTVEDPSILGNFLSTDEIYWSIETAASGLTLDSAPSTMAKAETGVSFVVSTPATVPTTGNTTVINSGDSLTVTSVTGSDPYTINCTVPVDITKQAGSYAWTVTVDAENVVSASIPLTVEAGWSNIVLDTPLTTSGYMLEGYAGDVPVTGDTMEYETTATLTPGTDSEWIWTVAPTVSQVVGRRVIQIDGTVGATADVTFTVSAPSSGSGIVRPLVRGLIQPLVKSIVH